MVTVMNVAPTLTLSGAATVAEGFLYTLGLTNSDPGSDTISSWQIAWGDGSVETVAGSVASATHVFADGPFACVISATATDEDGSYAAGNTVSVTVTNVAPTAAITGLVATGAEGTPITVSAIVTDPGADSFTYVWSVSKDGADYATGTDATFTFTPDDNGLYAVTLAVTDDDGAAGAAGGSVTVTDVAPTLVLSGPATVDEGAPYTLNFAKTGDPGDDTLTGWTIDWGDGNVDAVAASATSVTHVFADGPASYTIRATATDEDGVHAAANTVDVAVANVAPTAAILGLPAAGRNGTPVTLSAAVTDPGAEEFTYTWSVKLNGVDFAAGEGQSFSFAPGGDAVYTVILTVTDNDGATVQATGSMSVATEPPAPANETGGEEESGGGQDEGLAAAGGETGGTGGTGSFYPPKTRDTRAPEREEAARRKAGLPKCSPGTTTTAANPGPVPARAPAGVERGRAARVKAQAVRPRARGARVARPGRGSGGATGSGGTTPGGTDSGGSPAGGEPGATPEGGEPESRLDGPDSGSAVKAEAIARIEPAAEARPQTETRIEPRSGSEAATGTALAGLMGWKVISTGADPRHGAASWRRGHSGSWRRNRRRVGTSAGRMWGSRNDGAGGVRGDDRNVGAMRAMEITRGWEELQSARDRDAFAAAWLTVQCALVPGCLQGVLVLRNAAGGYAPVASWPQKSPIERLTGILNRALVEKQGMLVRLDPSDASPGGAGPYALAYPILVDEALAGVVALEVAASSEAELRPAMEGLQWARGVGREPSAQRAGNRGPRHPQEAQGRGRHPGPHAGRGELP